jgi:hypothetical protein
MERIVRISVEDASKVAPLMREKQWKVYLRLFLKYPEGKLLFAVCNGTIEHPIYDVLSVHDRLELASKAAKKAEAAL